MSKPLSVGGISKGSCKYSTIIKARAPKVIRLMALLKKHSLYRYNFKQMKMNNLMSRFVFDNQVNSKSEHHNYDDTEIGL